ncbi:MAG: DNA polymerase IV [Syntrophomonadaceae bacterium]|nr:DNA polymerase IV [Syntrophomonadaceae bacterium]
MTQDEALTIMHCDLDAFYAAVEQRDNPELTGKPVIVGGQPDTRGVVSTCSYEARKFGVRSAMPLAQARRLCPDAIFLPVAMSRYQEASRQVFAILHTYSPIIEPLSIDEAFLDLTGCTTVFGTVESIGREIKKRVRSEVGLTISVGISYNKFLAKLATELGKPDGLKIITRAETAAVLNPLPVSYLWGVGQKARQQLQRMGINTIGELAGLSPARLERQMGAHARVYWELAQGIDPRVVEVDHNRKSVGREITFPYDIANREELENVLLDLSVQVSRRLRRQRLLARTITLKLRYGNFRTLTRRTTLSRASSHDDTIYGAARELFARVFAEGDRIRLLGIYGSGLEPATGVAQGELFASAEQKRNETLDQTLDQIRDRFGEKIITRASLLPNSPFAERD